MRRVFAIATVLTAALALAIGCGKKDESSKNKAGEPQATESAGKKPPAPAPLTEEQKAAKLAACWKAFESGDDATLRSCYDTNATSTMVDAVPSMKTVGVDAIVATAGVNRKAFPGMKYELGVTLVRGDELVTIAANSGVNGGPFLGTPATGKKVGNYFGQYVELTPEGKAARVETYLAMHQLAAQMGLAKGMPSRPPLEPGVFPEHTVVYAADSDQEKANLEMVAAWSKAYNDHDVAAVMERYADDVLFRDITMAADLRGKEAVEKGLKAWFAMSSDAAGKALWSWAAGDYVVSAQESTGTWDGPIPGLPMKPTKKPFTTHTLDVVKIEGGKVKEHWIFGNSASFAVQVGLAPAPATSAPPAKAAAPAENAP